MRKTFTTQLTPLDAIRLEMDTAVNMQRMENNGFPLDVAESEKQIGQLQERVDWVDGAILPFIPSKPKIKGVPVEEPFKMNGQLKKTVLDWFGEDVPDIGGGFCRVDWIPMNLNSSKQVNEWLLENGWEPDEWNYKKDKSGKDIKDETGNKIKTSPKLTEESLESLEALGQAGRLIAYRRKCTHKRNQIQGFIKNLRLDGRVPSKVNSVGAATRRMTHSIIANVPKEKKGQFWKPMRKVFCAGHPDYVVVGADLSQIQIRGLAHYAALLCGDYSLVDTLVAGDTGEGPDVHEANGQTAGVTRDESKGIFYGYLFGSGIEKTANQLGISVKKAKAIRAKFDKALPFLKQLVDHLINFYRANGYITGLDGLPIYASSEHMLLVYLLQNFEVVIMKLAIREAELVAAQYDAKLATVQHDEVQYVVHKQHAEEFGKIIEQAFETAGTIVGSLCPITGEAEIGKTWYDTH